MNIMKNTTRLAVLAGVALLFGSALQSNAQYKAVGDDGIAASPKVRQMLVERRSSCDTCCAATKEARADHQRTAAALAAGSQIFGYRAAGDDGITASPKGRALLDAQKRTVEIAPLR